MASSRKDGKATTADILVDRLLDWGISVVFGLPGDGINGIMEALRARRERIRFVQVRHEEAAAFMACGYAKFTGELGVCLATSGPGAIHLLNGLYDAKLDGAPVLALTGQIYHDLLGTRYQQEVDLLRLFDDVALYNHQITGPEHVESLIDSACRAALGGKGVAHLTCSVDVQEHEAGDAQISKKKVPGHTSAIWTPPIAVPCPGDLETAARALNGAKKTVILAGQGALHARDEVLEAARILKAPVVKPLLGKAVIPDESPYAMGGIGLLGTLPSELAMEECDSLLIVGSTFPYLEFYPPPGQANAVQIDRDPARIGLRYPVSAPLAGDSKATLSALLPLLEERNDDAFLKESQQRMRDWRELMMDRSSRTDEPLKPQVVARQLSELLEDDALIAADTGTITTWVARHVDIRGTQQFAASGNLASMAPGLPYAIAAQIAYPQRRVVAFVGDGGFTMLMGELATAAKYELPITIVVIKNNTYGMIKWEQMVFLGNPEYGCELHPIDFVKFAEACGAIGLRCDKAADVRSTLARALAESRSAGKPALVEAVVDPFEPPHPARLKMEQAVHVAEALARGQPNRRRIALTLFRDKVHDLF